MKQVTIIGLGLIGTSLGLALKRLKSPPLVIGNDNQYDAASAASRAKAVDKIDRDVLSAVGGSELVVVATPVSAIPQVFKTIAAALDPGTTVTDTGSTKRAIVRNAEELLPEGVSFVGGHPMTGKATAGVDKPDASLFFNTVYCLTPTAAAPAEDVSKVTAMVQGIGASPYFLDPAEHDGLVAGISHLPHVVSAALMRVLSSETSWRELSELAAGGFELTTRLAAQEPKVFSDMFAMNGDNVARYLDRLIAELTAVRTKLAGSDPRILVELEAAQKARLDWEAQRRKAQEQQKH